MSELSAAVTEGLEFTRQHRDGVTAAGHVVLRCEHVFLTVVDSAPVANGMSMQCLGRV